MKQIVLWLLLIISFHQCALAYDLKIGQERIAPLAYPKFSVSGDYTFGRWFRGLADESLHGKLDNRFGAVMSVEAGLVKYFNAGALFTLSFSEVSTKGEPIDLRLGLFAKPYFDFTDYASIYLRAALGVSVPVFGHAIKSLEGRFAKSDTLKAAYEKIYRGQQYLGSPYGGFGSVAVGVEYFPWPRFGVGVEWGIRADIFHVSRKNPRDGAMPESVSDAPSSFNYMMYEMPFMLTVHAIL